MWDLREVHALWDGDGWVWNESFHIKDVIVGDEEWEPEEAFCEEYSRRYPKQMLELCECIEEDGIFELQIADTHEPFFAMVKVEE